MDVRTIADRWFAAFNAHDLEALLALYADHARHYSPKLKLHRPGSDGWVQGKDELRAWWQDAFERLPELRYDPIGTIVEDDRLFMEYDRYVPGEPSLRVGEVLEIENGCIVSSRVYHG